MNKRLFEILLYIYENPSELDMDILSNKFNISERVLKSDLNAINNILIKNDIGNLVSINNVITFEGSPVKIKNFLLSLDFYEYSLSKDERVIIIIILLFFIEKMTLDECADLLFVSRSTIIGDQSYLKTYLLNYGLELYTKSGYGIEITGDEENVRKLYVDILVKNSNLIRLLLIQRFDNKYIDNVFKNFALSDLKIQKIINEAEKLSNIVLTGNSNWIIKEYLKFSLFRMKSGYFINDLNIIFEENIFISGFYDKLISLLEDYYNIKLTLPEKEFLKYPAMFSRLINNPTEIFQDKTLQIQTISKKFIECVSNDMNIPLYKDFQLFRNLSMHLERIFGTERTRFIIYPDVEMIVNDNLYIKEIVEKNVHIIESYFQVKVTKAEIYYIVVYICASVEKFKQPIDLTNVLIVCNSGYGTSQLLKSKLEKQFIFNVKDIIPSHNLINENSNTLSEIDFIISTIDLNIDFPYVKVSPLLDKTDIARINNLIIKTIKNKPNHKILHSKKNEILREVKSITNEFDSLYENIKPLIDNYFEGNNNIALSDLLSKEFIQIDVDAKNWKDAIKKSSKNLLTNKFINKKYVDAMIKNYMENGPYFVIAPNFALPHASIKSGSLKLGMNLIRLKNPIVFNAGALDPVKYVCVISTIDNYSHLNAMFNLINILKDTNFRQDIDAATSSKEMANIIKYYEKELL